MSKKETLLSKALDYIWEVSEDDKQYISTLIKHCDFSAKDLLEHSGLTNLKATIQGAYSDGLIAEDTCKNYVARLNSLEKQVER